ncbi:hypothetical protein BASA61_008145 [Batrachochytrium salamandrivorans]|nr:hypothetical protein BASA61_008145 [Batrachochytrium salamandrivorans]
MMKLYSAGGGAPGGPGGFPGAGAGGAPGGFPGAGGDAGPTVEETRDKNVEITTQIAGSRTRSGCGECIYLAPR